MLAAWFAGRLALPGIGLESGTCRVPGALWGKYEGLSDAAIRSPSREAGLLSGVHRRASPLRVRYSPGPGSTHGQPGRRHQGGVRAKCGGLFSAERTWGAAGPAAKGSGSPMLTAVLRKTESTTENNRGLASLLHRV
jgi:hypothetical protein